MAKVCGCGNGARLLPRRAAVDVDGASVTSVIAQCSHRPCYVIGQTINTGLSSYTWVNSVSVKLSLVSLLIWL